MQGKYRTASSSQKSIIHITHSRDFFEEQSYATIGKCCIRPIRLAIFIFSSSDKVAISVLVSEDDGKNTGCINSLKEKKFISIFVIYIIFVI